MDASLWTIALDAIAIPDVTYKVQVWLKFEILRDSKLFTSLWALWSLWVPEHWDWVPSLMFLFIGNIVMCSPDACS